MLYDFSALVRSVLVNTVYCIFAFSYESSFFDEGVPWKNAESLIRVIVNIVDTTQVVSEVTSAL